MDVLLYTGRCARWNLSPFNPRADIAIGGSDGRTGHVLQNTRPLGGGLRAFN